MVAAKLATMKSGSRINLPPMGEKLDGKSREDAAEQPSVGTKLRYRVMAEWPILCHCPAVDAKLLACAASAVGVGSRCSSNDQKFVERLMAAGAGDAQFASAPAWEDIIWKRKCAQWAYLTAERMISHLIAAMPDDQLQTVFARIIPRHGA